MNKTETDVGKKWLKFFRGFQVPFSVVIAIELTLYYFDMQQLTPGGETSFTVVLVIFGISVLSGFYFNYIED